MLIRGDKGITFIELLVSMAIIALLAVSFYQILSTFYRNFETQDAIAEMQQQGRFAADLVSREIRQTGYDPRGVFFTSGSITDGNPDNNCDSSDANASVERILEAGPSIFHYLADLDENGVPGGSNEHIRYEWVGSTEKDVCGRNRVPNTLYRNNGSGMQPVSSHIIAFDFQYFNDDNEPIPDTVLDADGNPIPNTRALTRDERAEIWKVSLSLTAQTDRPDKDYPENGGYRRRTFVYDIWLKNT